MNADPFLACLPQFEALSAAWLDLGASCVRLLEGERVLAVYPAGADPAGPALVGRSAGGPLSLHLHRLKGRHWQPLADAQAELLSALLTAETDLDSLTAALVETQDRLVALYELTQAARHTFEVPALLELLTSAARRLLDVTGAFAVLLQPGQPAVIHQSAEARFPDAHLQAAAMLFRRTPRRHTFKDSATLPVGLQNVMMVRLEVREQVFAVLGVFNKTGDFNSPDVKLAQAIADQAGAQIENALLYQEALERTRLETEMKLANQVQTALLPQSLPVLKDFDIFATSLPALEVGGDLLDLIPRPGKPLTLVLGDVTGKGMPSALLMAMTRTDIRTAVRNAGSISPDEIVSRLNGDLYEDFSKVGMFTTLFVGQLDEAARRLSFCNAGQSPILHLPRAGEPRLLEAADIPVGVFDGYEYRTERLDFEPGDVLLAASDGIPETRNPQGELFGYERLGRVLAASRDLPARRIAEALIRAASEFSGDHPQDDDRTLLVLKRGASSSASATLTVRTGYESLREPTRRLADLLAAAGAPQETVNGCELALQELLTNIVDHGFGGDPSHSIQVRLTLEPDRLTVETSDDGLPAALDLESVAMPDPSELKEGGYGLALIKSLMDEVDYRTAGGVNTWRLVKKLAKTGD